MIGKFTALYSKSQFLHFGISYSARALADLERVVDLLLQSEPVKAPETLGLITSAIETLHDHPLIGRPYGDRIRELVVSRGHTGHVVLYRLWSADDVVAILSVRHQRGVGYSDGQGEHDQ